MPDESLSTDDFAAQLAGASATPEQPAAQDSGAEAAAAPGEAAGEADPSLLAEQPETDSEEAAQEEPAAEDDARVIKWTTAAGETYEVPEAELKNGYMRQEAFTRETQRLADQQRQAQAQFQTQVQTLHALSSDIGRINALQSQIQQFQGVDFNALRAADPLQAAQLQTQFLALRQELNDAQNQASQKSQALSSHQQQQFEQAVSATEQHLTKKVPNISRDEVVQTFSRLRSMGASDVELNQMRAMPWLVEAAVYANRWMDLQAKKPGVQNKVQKLPPASAAKPSRPAVPSSKSEAVLKALDSRKSFSTEEFARMMKAASR